ncbi:MAG: MotA/TolQ/ExbB proton channel family protein [Magnetococcales bacterium]|uniref:MotA/TolQ/ExbB proton channel family protein n=1 Tax=Candidatus Magnetobacterium casense TaxID=1455061 RepID=A0ABS6S083_9BACT|nr:MotA/TolQ/ExbB proton channel family protein [Candidatus Magnetobacterium casensis]MBF0608866.1 MotA/TolQ/ExbB proton channel family protein [Nitrospirota bacterium]MBV6341798.1 MotA/TolQ/ExbB proton channel family protein [Candidatus Magnetobacterium casensis]
MKTTKLLTGFLLVAVLAVVLVSLFKGMGAGMLLNVDAFVIVIGGTFVGSLIGFPMRRIKATVVDVISSFRDKGDKDYIVREIQECAFINRNDGLRTLEDKVSEIRDDFLRFGMNLVVNSYSDNAIRDIMEREMNNKLVNLNFSQNVLKTIARLTPSLGLAGTVVSLIKMFKSLDSVETLAPMMAVALMSTFYGVIASNLIAIPLCAKLKERAMMLEAHMALVITGTMCVSDLEHPTKIEEKLRQYDDVEEVVGFKGQLRTIPASGLLR